MIGQYLRMIEELKPDGFLLENVASLLHPKNIKAVSDLKEGIDKLGYKFILYKANSADFGVPQKRKRVFFIASKKEVIGEPIKTHGSEKDRKLNKNLLPYERVIDWIGKFDDDRYFEQEELTIGKTYDTELKEIPMGKNYFALTERDGYPNPKFKANTRFWSFLLKLHPHLLSWTISAQPGPWVGPFHWNSRRLRVPEIAALQSEEARRQNHMLQGTNEKLDSVAERLTNVNVKLKSTLTEVGRAGDKLMVDIMCIVSLSLHIIFHSFPSYILAYPFPSSIE